MNDLKFVIVTTESTTV